jgi:hypothetical protein
LSDSQDDLWQYRTDSQSIRKGIAYLYPFVENKTLWPLEPDVMYWDEWPVAHPFLVFGSLRFKNKNWFNTWKNLDHAPVNEEVIRNLPIRNPLIWMIN